MITLELTDDQALSIVAPLGQLLKPKAAVQPTYGFSVERKALPTPSKELPTSKRITMYIQGTYAKGAVFSSAEVARALGITTHNVSSTLWSRAKYNAGLAEMIICGTWRRL